MEITKSMYELAKLIVSEYENSNLDESIKVLNCVGEFVPGAKISLKLDESGDVSAKITPPKKEKEPHKNDYTTSVIDCYESCLSQFPIDLRPSTMSEQVKWLDEIDKLNRLDHLQYSDIILLTKCAREDKFWSKNFLTLRKLRRKNKDGIPHWKLFRENFKFEQSKTQEVQSAYEQAKERLGI